MYTIGTYNKIAKVGLDRLTDDFILIDNPTDANGLIVRSFDMHNMVFAHELMAIGRAGAGFNNIPVEHCAEKGIVVFNTPGANANAVAELCVAGIIMAARNIPSSIKWAKTLVGSENIGKQVEDGKKQFAGSEIRGKTLGIIGLGAVGYRFANAAVALGMKVVGYDAFLSEKSKKALSPEVKILDTLEELYPVCDYISIHVPANDQTKGMMNAAAFAQMKDGVIFINAARDKLMNDDDLLEALESGKVGQYVTDFADDQILNADRDDIIIMPHLGASSAEAEENCAIMAVDQVMDYLANGNIINSVNLPNLNMGPRKDARIGVIALADSDAKAQVEAIATGEVASAERNGYVYVLAEVPHDTHKDAVSGEGIIRVRVMK